MPVIVFGRSGLISSFPAILTNTTFMKTIGAESVWIESDDGVYNNFDLSGDWIIVRSL